MRLFCFYGTGEGLGAQSRSGFQPRGCMRAAWVGSTNPFFSAPCPCILKQHCCFFPAGAQGYRWLAL